MLPSNFGTVRDKQRLAAALPAEVWGIEHGYLSTGDPMYLAPVCLEAQAKEYAKVLLDALQHTGRRTGQRVNLFGGSFDGLLAAKVCDIIVPGLSLPF